jgi:hypothetical protein
MPELREYWRSAGTSFELMKMMLERNWVNDDHGAFCKILYIILRG